MPTIHLKTFIAAPSERVFDLARSIDLHKLSTTRTREGAIAGVTSGLISMGQEVTWRATHFGIRQKLTSRITEYERPLYFSDEMVSGVFKRFKHRHNFQTQDGGTLLIDIFDYNSPLGLLGRFVDWLFLQRYMTNFQKARNKVLKMFAESDKWKEILEEK